MSAINEAFGLSYANYLVIPRLALESMPEAWQRRFVAMIEDVQERYDFEPPRGYRVHATDKRGRFVRDEWSDYRHGEAIPRAAQPVAPPKETT